jgi:hypothetical protein
LVGTAKVLLLVGVPVFDVDVIADVWDAMADVCDGSGEGIVAELGVGSGRVAEI